MTTTPQAQPARHAVDNEASFGQLVASASRDLSGLVHAEIELAKTELRADAKAAAAGGAMFAVAGVFGLLLLIMLLIAYGEGLVTVGLARWVAYLIVAGTLMVLAGIVSLIGFIAIRRVRPPRRTIETTKQTVATLRSRGGEGTAAHRA